MALKNEIYNVYNNYKVMSSFLFLQQSETTIYTSEYARLPSGR